MVSVLLEDAWVSYPVKMSIRSRSTMAAMANSLSFGHIAQEKTGPVQVEAVRGVSIKLEPGERLAIIGKNGAGKSTLLKAIAGIIPLSSGNREVIGTRLSLLALGAGTEIERSARDNLHTIGNLLGIDKADMPDYIANVMEFTELGKFFELPLSSYSSGMLVRFMFGAMTYQPADIMIVDEIIGAGDASFVKKAQARSMSLYEQSNILVLSTHAPQITYELCNRAILMERGKIVADGAPHDIWKFYHKRRK